MKKITTLILTGLLSISVQAKKDEVVRLYTWGEYINDEIITAFTKETGIKVEVSAIESNESMYAKLKLQGKNSSYDVITPSNYFVSRMIKEGMLSPLDHKQLPVIKELNQSWLNASYDPKNKYSLPEFLGVPLIAFSTDKFKKSDFKSWADLWKPEYKGKVQLLDDAREVFNIALLKLGKNPNTQNPKDIKLAFEELKKLRPNVVAFNSDNPEASFISGDVELGQMWNGSMKIAKDEGAAVDSVYPKEGTVLWVDTLAIPKYAKNKKAAHKLINFLLSEKVAEKMVNIVGFPNSNHKVFEKLPAKVKNDRSIYPSDEFIKKAIWQTDVGKALPLYEEYYQQFKAMK